MFTSFNVQDFGQCIVISGMLAAVGTLLFVRRFGHRRSTPLQFGPLGTMALAVLVFVTLFVTVFFGVL
jgi:hypothetical protein